MSVYVDEVGIAFGRMIMCHMIADTLDELHMFARRLDMRPAWFQAAPPASFPHYDISKSKRSLAIKLGAIEVDRNQLVKIMAGLRPGLGIYGRGNPAPKTGGTP